MSEHDFSDLFQEYESIIDQMPNTFTSHQFILKLAQQNQSAYIEALYSYRNHKHRDAPAPFLYVHRVLSQHLSKLPNLITKTRDAVPSVDIFGQANTCTEWKKV